MALYKTANSFFQEQFGQKVYKLALDGGFTCPNRDGTVGVGGCIFCSAGGSGDFAEKPCGDVAIQLARAKARVAGKMHGNAYIAYFQSFTNTYASVDRLRAIFQPVLEDPSIVGLSIATRPDCLPPETIALISELNKIKPVMVELGLQTIHEETTRLIRRGYPLSTYDKAMADLGKIGVHIITHIILGLPGETPEMMVETARYVGNSGSQGVKLQLLHVLKGTDLADLSPETLSEEAYLDILCRCIQALPEGTVLHRLTGDAPWELLIAPRWSLDKKRVLQAIKDRCLQEGIEMI